MIHFATGSGEHEKEVEEEIENFSSYIKTLHEDGLGLSKPERALIKTFCAYLLGMGPENPRCRKES